MERRRSMLSLLLGLLIGLGLCPSSAPVGSAHAAETASRFQGCRTISGHACGALARWASYATTAAVQLVKLAEEETARRAALEAQAASKTTVIENAHLPAWVTCGLIQPRTVAGDGLPWVGPLSSDPARSTDLSFAYAPHSWLSVTKLDSQDSVREEVVPAAVMSAQRAETRNLSRLAADPRHSTGSDEVVAINSQHEGLQAAPRREVSDEQVRHWFEDYTFGYEYAAHDMLAGLENSRPVRRPAAIAPPVDGRAPSIKGGILAASGALVEFETLLDGPRRYVFLRAANRPQGEISAGNVASIACRDAATLAANEAEERERAKARAWVASMANTINQCGSALLGISQKLTEIAAQNGPVVARQVEERAELSSGRNDAADSRADDCPWSGCDDWDLEASVTTNPYLGL
jgi:hypothetical protein